MTMVRIASVRTENKMTLELLLQLHNICYRFDKYENNKGFHVYISLNHETYFREIVAPEYKAALATSYNTKQQVKQTNLYGASDYGTW